MCEIQGENNKELEKESGLKNRIQPQVGGRGIQRQCAESLSVKYVHIMQILFNMPAMINIFEKAAVFSSMRLTASVTQKYKKVLTFKSEIFS